MKVDCGATHVARHVCVVASYFTLRRMEVFFSTTGQRCSRVVTSSRYICLTSVISRMERRSPVVKLLNKRWRISIDARREGPKLEPEGQRAEVGFPTADQGFSSIQGTLFGFLVWHSPLLLWGITRGNCFSSIDFLLITVFTVFTLHTHIRLTALFFRDYPGEPVPER